MKNFERSLLILILYNILCIVFVASTKRDSPDSDSGPAGSPKIATKRDSPDSDSGPAGSPKIATKRDSPDSDSGPAGSPKIATKRDSPDSDSGPAGSPKRQRISLENRSNNPIRGHQHGVKEENEPPIPSRSVDAFEERDKVAEMSTVGRDFIERDGNVATGGRERKFMGDAFKEMVPIFGMQEEVAGKSAQAVQGKGKGLLHGRGHKQHLKLGLNLGTDSGSIPKSAVTIPGTGGVAGAATGQSSSSFLGAITSAKNWISSNLDSFKKDETVIKPKHIDKFLKISDIVGNIVTGQIGSALFNVMKSQVENSEQEKLFKQMEEMNNEYKKYYDESLKMEKKEEICRMDKRKNSGNDCGYLQNVVMKLNLLQSFINALFEAKIIHSEQKTEESLKNYINAIRELEIQCKQKNVALQALKAIQTYVDDSVRPDFYSVYILDHEFKKMELIRFAKRIDTQARQLFFIANVCIKPDDFDKKKNFAQLFELYKNAESSSIQFKIIGETYNNIENSLNIWINRALNLAWPAVIKEKAIPEVIKEVKLMNNIENDGQINDEMLELIAQKIVQEAMQYGRECFKYQAIVANDGCSLKDKKCPLIDLPEYSKLDPEITIDFASSSSSKVATGNGSMRNSPICIFVEHSGLQIMLARMFIVDDDEHVPSHSRAKYEEKIVKELAKNEYKKLMEDIQSGLPQKITGGLWLGKSHNTPGICSIGVASEPGGAADYGLERFEKSTQEQMMHFFFMNPKISYHKFDLLNKKDLFELNIQKTIFIDIEAKLFQDANSYTVNLLNKDGIVLHHLHDFTVIHEEKTKIRVGQFVDKNKPWMETNGYPIQKNFFIKKGEDFKLRFEVYPQKIVTHLNGQNAYEFKWAKILAPIERLVIAGDLRLLRIAQIDEKYSHERELYNRHL